MAIEQGAGAGRRPTTMMLLRVAVPALGIGVISALLLASLSALADQLQTFSLAVAA